MTFFNNYLSIKFKKIALLSLVGILFVEVGKLAPRVEVKPERVELLDVIVRRFVVAQFRHRLLPRPSNNFF